MLNGDMYNCCDLKVTIVTIALVMEIENDDTNTQC